MIPQIIGLVVLVVVTMRVVASVSILRRKKKRIKTLAFFNPKK
jgi:hypothetical protein